MPDTPHRPLGIATFNVNGIRAARRRGFDAWLAGRGLDVVALQELRCPREEVGAGEVGPGEVGAGEHRAREGRALELRLAQRRLLQQHAAEVTALGLGLMGMSGVYGAADDDAVTGGQSVADLLARLQHSGPTEGGRRRRRED